MPKHRQANETDEEAVVSPVDARQGTGPSDMFGVLAISLLLTAAAGTALLAYFLS